MVWEMNGGAVKKAYSDPCNYDLLPSEKQELTFLSAEKFFEEKAAGLPFDDFIRLRLVVPAPERNGILPSENPYNYLYTNAAFLLSDQCDFEIQCAVFVDKISPRGCLRRTFSGSVLRQYAETYEFVSLSSAAFDKRRRLRADTDYFVEAFRELLLNAIIHRDYGEAGRIQINVYDGRVDILSPGGPAKGVTLKSLLNFEAMGDNRAKPGLRNETLAYLFRELDLFAGSGDTIKLILSKYSECLIEPAIRISNASFFVSLPRMIGGLTSTRGHSRLKEELIIKTISQRGSVTRIEVENILKSSRNTAITLLDGLIDEGKVVKIGTARSVRYILPQ